LWDNLSQILKFQLNSNSKFQFENFWNPVWTVKKIPKFGEKIFYFLLQKVQLQNLNFQRIVSKWGHLKFQTNFFNNRHMTQKIDIIVVIGQSWNSHRLASQFCRNGKVERPIQNKVNPRSFRWPHSIHFYMTRTSIRFIISKSYCTILFHIFSPETHPSKWRHL
jgi:hypothetical protein